MSRQWSKGMTSCLIVLAACTLPSAAHATLKFYYDPATGNVSFDTTETRSGAINTYVLAIDRRTPSPLRFRTDEYIKISNSSLNTNSPFVISDFTSSNPFRGLYTVGNVLPVGLTEEFWTSFFAKKLSPINGLGSHDYTDIVGNPLAPPAEFIYGPPEGEFQNRVDLIDPDSLTWAERATLTYYAATGEVVVDTTGAQGGHITGVMLKSDGAFNPTEFDPSIDTGPFSSCSGDLAFLFSDLIEPGRISLGKILPAGLDPSLFEATLESAQFLGRAGFKSRDFDFEGAGLDFNLAFVAVPEPLSGALAIAALAAIAPLGRRAIRRYS